MLEFLHRSRVDIVPPVIIPLETLLIRNPQPLPFLSPPLLHTLCYPILSLPQPPTLSPPHHLQDLLSELALHFLIRITRASQQSLLVSLCHQQIYEKRIIIKELRGILKIELIGVVIFYCSEWGSRCFIVITVIANIFIMQSLEAVEETLNHIFSQGANVLYSNYITHKLPDHLHREQTAAIREICAQQFTQAEKSTPIATDSQPQNIQRDNQASKQVKKRVHSVVRSPPKEITMNKSKAKISGRYSTRPTTAGKSLSSTFTKMKFVPDSKLIKLYQEEKVYGEYQRFEDEMRKHKRLEHEKTKELEQTQRIEDLKKNKASEMFFEQFRSLKERNIKTTFQFNGNVLGVTGRPIGRKLPPTVDCFIKQGRNPNKPLKTPKSKMSQKHSSQISQNNVFTSLIYEMHSTKNSSKLQGRFYKNDQYNNNNIRQTSHANFINLKEGVSLYQPGNMVSLSNARNPEREFAESKTATFKHFLLDNIPVNQDSLEIKKQDEGEEEEYVHQTNKKDSGEIRTYLGSKDSSRFRSTAGNKFASFYRPMTAQSIDCKKKIPARPQTSKNNGRQRIIVSQNMLNVMMG